jgi:hypothetical protein
MERFLEVNRGGLNKGIGISGIGYVVVPDNTLRQTYIDDCFRTCTVTINGGYASGLIAAVRIPKELLSEIHFPVNEGELGTQVFWVREAFSNHPVIVQVLQKDGYTNLLKENQKRTVVQLGDKVVEIFQDAATGTLNINVVGEDSIPAIINIKAITGTTDSILNIITDGTLTAEANDLVANVLDSFSIMVKSAINKTLLSLVGNGDGLTYNDQNNNAIVVNKDNIQFKSKTINLGNGKEPLVLGKQLVNVLSQLITAITQLTVICKGSTSSVPVNAAAFTTIKSTLNNILSTLSNTD